ncbi:3-deoxy-D-manno-octulosonic acid kinase [Saliniradius amylolyticus]|uniref:3-deoxy-D-manno-octulosonic acid kinase n=1 Tax=Saliniradius amylolyticus TaxID=2183582 RepID=A0A2S2E0L6_9ALTE|nr:3-deoxy-D-manno-octulosonic acid kinase [Saliniradius amylolyticus]AWL10557.1 3-deoxy-D-manno-octulosonic acid kinase [Saliniradius amylolyticus]
MGNLPQNIVTMTRICTQTAKPHYFLFDREQIDSMSAQLFTPDFWRERGKLKGQASGRGTTVFVQAKEHTRWALRHFHRGGMVGKLLTDQYLFTGLERSRPWREFYLLYQLRKQGLNVPKPVAAHVEKRGLTYCADLITELIPKCQDLHQILSQRPLTGEEWQRVGAAIATLHRHQVYHHDLNIRNIMMDQDGQVWIIDFDRCYIRSGEQWKQEPINRLKRSLQKASTGEHGFNWGSTDWELLQEGLD